MKIAVCISGASGAILAKRTIEELKKRNHELLCVVSDTAREIFSNEIGESVDEFLKKLNINRFSNNDMHSPLASGSFLLDATLVIPCSMKTLSSIAIGYTDSLITRCCDVAIKQKRKLILIPREMPLSAIHLENMLKLARIGVTILPPMLTFYTKPENLNDMINFVVGRVLDELSIEHNLFERWGGNY